jgi:hypothetical protein
MMSGSKTWWEPKNDDENLKMTTKNQDQNEDLLVTWLGLREKDHPSPHLQKKFHKPAKRTLLLRLWLSRVEDEKRSLI